MERSIDVVVFGASGFTGKYVVRELLRFHASRTMAVAGRHRSKLSSALAWAASPHSPPQLPLIEADVTDFESLKAMCRQTRLVLSCVGPYRLYGEPVIAACVAEGTDYLDVSGEPEFMERMEAKYHDQAKARGCLIVSACGYDSIPAEIGLLHHLKSWLPPSLPNSVNAVLHLTSSLAMAGNTGTWESAVLGISSAHELRKLRQKRRKERPHAKITVPGAAAKKPSPLSRCKDIGLSLVPLPNADASVVRRTQSAIAAGEVISVDEEEEEHLSDTSKEKRRNLFKPVHFGVYLGVTGLFHLLSTIWTGLSLTILANFGWGRKLLLAYPSFFSCGQFRHGGPSEEQVAAASFDMWFVGRGYSDISKVSGGPIDTQITTRLSGPEIGYVTTPICLVQCALIVLDERRSLPRGGCFTPGAVFGTTDLEERLKANGLTFEFVSRVKI